MASTEKKREEHEKKPSLVLPHTLQFSSLPHELVVSYLACISKSYYQTLSLVSKTFGSLLASPELYKTRSLSNRTESFLYVCLEFPCDPVPHWFTLFRKPNHTLPNDTRKNKKREAIGNVLVPISSPSSSAKAWSSTRVVVGSDIYEIGGINDERSSSVVVLNCRSDTWQEAPHMCEKRVTPSANVIDGKIYVAGGRENDNYDNRSGWMEVFDPKNQTWKHVLTHGTEIYQEYEGTCVTVGIDGKIYIYDNIGMSYNPKDGTCESEEWINNMFYYGMACSRCVINNVLFCYYKKMNWCDNKVYHYDFKWFDTKVREWRNFKGLEGLPNFRNYSNVHLSDYGGNMVVFWEEHNVHDTKGSGIWCAEIALERCNNEEDISGKVVWSDVVLQLPSPCLILSVRAATV